MTFMESLLTSGAGFLVVFIGLGVLIGLVYALGAISEKLLSDDGKAVAPAAKAAAPTAPAVQAKAEIANREELVAIFSAAVAEQLGTDVSAIRVVSLKQVQ